MLTQSLGHLS